MRNLSVEDRVAKVSFVYSLSIILSIAIQLISVPVCLKYWGNEIYGMWLAVFAAFILMRTVDAGYTTYIGNNLNLEFHGDQKKLKETLATSFLGAILLGLLQLFIVLLVVGLGGASWLLGASIEISANHQAGAALLIIIGTWAIFGPYLSILHRLFIPTGMMSQAAWWAMGFQVSQFAAVMIAAVLQFNLFQTAILFSIVQATIYLGSIVYLKRRLPDYYPWWRGIKYIVGIRDLMRSLPMIFASVLQQGTENGVVIMVSAISGPAAVPAFTTIKTIAYLWGTITNIFTRPLLPDIVRYHAKLEKKKLIATNEAHWLFVGTAVNLGVLVSYPFINLLYGYWTNHTVALNKPLICLLLAGTVLANAGALITTYLQGINSLIIILGTSAGRGFLSLVLGGILLTYWGLGGLGLGIFLGELVALLAILIFFFRSALSRFGVSPQAIAFGPITISTFAVLVFLGSEGLSLPITWGVYPASIAGVVFGALWGWSKTDSEVKRRVEHMIGKWIRKKGTV